jgi:hypothetical protein
MAHQFRTETLAILVTALAWAGSACDGGDDESNFSRADGAVVFPDASGLPGGDATVGATTGGGTMGGATTGGTAVVPDGGGTAGLGGGQQGGSTAGSLDAGAGGLFGGRDAGTEAGGARDSGGGATDATTPVGDGGGGDYEAARQVCLDTINMYRATRQLPPLMRAPAAAEVCADEGAKYDGDLNRGKPPDQVVGHKSTSNRSAACRTVGFGAQNACPNYPLGRPGYATVADSLKKCLAQMWAEGEPPVPIPQCTADQSVGGCFLKHGHWINMVSTSSTWVACGFYDVGGGSIWMNQDFNFARR